MKTWKSHTTKWGRPRSPTCRVRGTQVERRAKRARCEGFSAFAKEFNQAFDKVFCASRPWLRQRKDGFEAANFRAVKVSTP